MYLLIFQLWYNNFIMEDKEIDKIYELIDSEKHEEAKTLIVEILDKDPTDIDAQDYLHYVKLTLNTTTMQEKFLKM